MSEGAEFVEAVKKSLDKDLADMLYNRRVSAVDAMALQQLRIARGRAFFMQNTATGVQGWTPDGVKFYPSEPGTFTEASGEVPPVKEKRKK